MAAAFGAHHEWGRLREVVIGISPAHDAEKFTTLDGVERTLVPGDLVIRDGARAIGLAGVMGGANSEVGAATTRVFLESAYFAPGPIRRTSRALGLRTDAAYRFERGADIEGLVDAGARAAQLMAELAGGTAARGMNDVYRQRRKPVRVRLRLARVERVLGIAPTRPHARRILTGLGLGVRDRGRDLDVEIPSFRRDLGMEDDLAEELMRVWGYDKLPSTLPGGAVVRVARESDRLRQEGLVRRTLAETVAGIAASHGCTGEVLTRGVQRLSDVHARKADLKTTDRGLVWNTDRSGPAPGSNVRTNAMDLIS